MQIIKRSPNTKRKTNLYSIEPVEYDLKPLTKRLAVFDTETDPFADERVVAPFTCGIYFGDTGEYYDFWGDDCIAQFFEFMDANYSEEELQVCVHNGGNFDFYFFVDQFDAGMKPFIINGRLVRVIAHGIEFRDSYAMIPVALGKTLSSDDGGKLEIDYSKFEREADYYCIKTREKVSPRELHKDEILPYQRRDCTALYTLVKNWYDMFGDKLTMASVALPMLRSYHGFETMLDNIDTSMRPYYFGGRCQAFEVGVLTPKSIDRFNIYDVNSMYPYVMATDRHPISSTPRFEKRITERTQFARVRAWSNGALPVRLETGGLDFPVGTRDFFAGIHEINAGLETGTLRIIKVYETIYFDAYTSFKEFIDTFYKLRMDASAIGDEIHKLFYKLVMNSSYGKFAQDPRKYENWLFNPIVIPKPMQCEPCYNRVKKGLDKVPCIMCDKATPDFSPFGWYLHTVRGEYNIYAQPQQVRAGKGFFNVATAASITSAARALLLRGISNATRPIYCDTDSIMCEALDNVPIGSKELGAWKLEAQGDLACIGGKKLYAVFDNDKEVKKASKGVRLSAYEIARICQGETIEYSNPVPKFHLDGSTSFITRNIKATG